MRTRIKNVRVALPALLAVGAIAAAVAGCGGGRGYGAARSGASQSTPSVTHQATTSAPAAIASAGIPQQNGGDMDADNNGGPSDGDGNQ